MLALLGPLGALLGLEASSLKERLKRQAVLWGIVGALGLIAVTFILVAINTALTYAVGAVIAPLIISGAALLIGLAVYMVFHFRETMEAHKDAEKKRSAEVTALITTAAITAIPLILPTLKKVGVPTASAAAAVYSLLQAKALRRDD
jgi:predicted tellurium resistance membrane protein TerC